MQPRDAYYSNGTPSSAPGETTCAFNAEKTWRSSHSKKLWSCSKQRGSQKGTSRPEHATGTTFLPPTSSNVVKTTIMDVWSACLALVEVAYCPICLPRTGRPQNMKMRRTGVTGPRVKASTPAPRSETGDRASIFPHQSERRVDSTDTAAKSP